MNLTKSNIKEITATIQAENAAKNKAIRTYRTHLHGQEVTVKVYEENARNLAPEVATIFGQSKLELEELQKLFDATE